MDARVGQIRLLSPRDANITKRKKSCKYIQGAKPVKNHEYVPRSQIHIVNDKAFNWSLIVPVNNLAHIQKRNIKSAIALFSANKR